MLKTILNFLKNLLTKKKEAAKEGKAVIENTLKQDLVLLVEELNRDEGRVLRLYDDATGKEIKKGDTLKGYPSIGTGRNLQAKGISENVAEIMLYEDIIQAVDNLNKHLPWWVELDNVRQRALINMCFNMGIFGLLKFKNTLAAIQDERWDDAHDGIMNSLYARQVGGRAVRVAEMIQMGSAYDDGPR